MAFAQTWIVEKANKCLDFTVTISVLRVAQIWFFYEFPWQRGFWVNEVLWATVACLLAEALCMRAESKEIPLKINELLE